MNKELLIRRPEVELMKKNNPYKAEPMLHNRRKCSVINSR